MKHGGAFWPASVIDGERVAFLKPVTYMNLSGKSVGEAARYNEVSPEDILVLFDDTALPFGKLRYRSNGSAGGHKGMASVLGAFETLGVPRLRVGVDAPPGTIAMKDWVLGKFTKDQRGSWPKIEDLAWDALTRWLRGEVGPGFTVQLPGGDGVTK
jgi:PTH1 family peptidyl-tRNA hydrolase